MSNGTLFLVMHKNVRIRKKETFCLSTALHAKRQKAQYQITEYIDDQKFQTIHIFNVLKFCFL